jgi:peptide/nickel transport system permease protein
MLRPSAIGLAVGCVVIAAFVAISGQLTDAASAIDTSHWVGSPLPPCFVNARVCGGHVLGTDEVGRDMLIRLIVGLRTTLTVSLFALFSSIAIALALALSTRRVAFARAVVDRVAAAISVIPPWPYVAIISFVSIQTSEPHLGGLWLALWAGILSWPPLWRHMRGSWSPASILGGVCRAWSALILTFVTVDFFGYGVQPPLPSLGNMLVEAEQNMQIAWWAAVFPALCIFILVLMIEIGARVRYSVPDGVM